MAETIVSTYRSLFQLVILHHYWLDDGSTVTGLDPAGVATRPGYDVRDWMAIEPLPSTQERLRGLRARFATNTLGGVVVIPAAVTVPATAVFEFALRPRDPAFWNYTAQTLAPRSLHELYDPVSNRRLRYRENALLLSNLSGTARTDTEKYLFLSREIPAGVGGEPLEALVRNGNALQEVISDQTHTRTLANMADDLPVFVHQEDAPAIVAPPGLAGSPPARGLLLTDEMPDDIYALVRIAAEHPGDPDFSCTAGGRAKAEPPRFQIRCKNRSTYRRYRHQDTGQELSVESNPLPLTYRGNTGSGRKPGLAQVGLGPVTGLDPANRLISDIFI